MSRQDLFLFLSFCFSVVFIDGSSPKSDIEKPLSPQFKPFTRHRSMPIPIKGLDQNDSYRTRSMSSEQISELMKEYKEAHAKIFKLPMSDKDTQTDLNSVRQEESSPFFLMDDDESSSTK